MGVATYREHLAAVKSEITEISAQEAAARVAEQPGPVLIDVRERDEYEQGFIPGALHIPRGNLESRSWASRT
jgi:rhodanese-related sulfurtransferase